MDDFFDLNLEYDPYIMKIDGANEKAWQLGWDPNQYGPEELFKLLEEQGYTWDSEELEWRHA